MNAINQELHNLNEVVFVELEDLYNKIRSYPDNKQVKISAGALKNTCETQMAMIAYITGNLEYVKSYLESKNLI